MDDDARAGARGGCGWILLPFRLTGSTAANHAQGATHQLSAEKRACPHEAQDPGRMMPGLSAPMQPQPCSNLRNTLTLHGIEHAKFGAPCQACYTIECIPQLKGASRMAQPSTASGKKICMPSVLSQFSMRLSRPAVLHSSMSVIVNTGISHDLQATFLLSLMTHRRLCVRLTHRSRT